MKTCVDSAVRFMNAMKMAVTQIRQIIAASPKTVRLLIPMILKKSIVPQNPSP